MYYGTVRGEINGRGINGGHERRTISNERNGHDIYLNPGVCGETIKCKKYHPGDHKPNVSEQEG